MLKPVIQSPPIRFSADLIVRPLVVAPASAPSIRISGPLGFLSPIRTVWLKPSMYVPASVNVGSGEAGLIVQTPGDGWYPGSVVGMANRMVSAPACGVGIRDCLAERTRTAVGRVHHPYDCRGRGAVS